jgi:hypothetical protein
MGSGVFFHFGVDVVPCGRDSVADMKKSPDPSDPLSVGVANNMPAIFGNRNAGGKPRRGILACSRDPAWNFQRVLIVLQAIDDEEEDEGESKPRSAWRFTSLSSRT